VELMKTRYFYFAAAVAFFVGAVVEIMSPRALRASLLDLGAGAIFLFLALWPQSTPKPPK
jgi:hypothetical protein